MIIYLYLAFILIFIALIYMYKIPIVCYGCESPEGFARYVFKCVNDTSPDSKTCKISKTIEDITNKGIEKAKVISKAVFDEITKNIPKNIKEFLKFVIDKITSLAKDLIEKLKNFAKELYGFIKKTFSDIKDFIIKTAKDFYNLIIKPVLDFVTEYIIEPILELVELLIKLKNIVTDAIKGAVRDVTGVIINFSDLIIKPITNLPKEIENLINIIIRLINSLAKGGVATLNSSLKTSIDGIETVTNEMIKGINTSVSTIIGGVESAVNDTTKPIINTVNDVLKGYNGIKNWNLKLEVPKVVIIPPVCTPRVPAGCIPEVCLLGVCVPEICIPEIPEQCGPEAAIGPISLIDTKPLGGLPSANEIQYDGVKIDAPKINNVDIQEPVIPDPNPIAEVDLKPITKAVNDSFNSAYDFVTRGIKDAYDRAMKPMKDAITTLLTLAATIKTAIDTFIKNYLSWEFLKKVFEEIKKGIKITVQEALKLINENIIKPIIEIVKLITNEIMKGVNFIISKLKELILLITTEVNKLFKIAANALYDASKFIFRNIFKIGFFYFSNIIGILIPLPMSKTAKINLVLLLILGLIFIGISLYVGVILSNILLIIGIAILFTSMSLSIPKNENKQNIDTSKTIENPFEDDYIPFEDDYIPFEDDYIPFEDDYIEEFKPISYIEFKKCNTQYLNTESFSLYPSFQNSKMQYV